MNTLRNIRDHVIDWSQGATTGQRVRVTIAAVVILACLLYLVAEAAPNDIVAVLATLVIGGTWVFTVGLIWRPRR